MAFWTKIIILLQVCQFTTAKRAMPMIWGLIGLGVEKANYVHRIAILLGLVKVHYIV